MNMLSINILHANTAITQVLACALYLFILKNRHSKIKTVGIFVLFSLAEYLYMYLEPVIVYEGFFWPIYILPMLLMMYLFLFAALEMTPKTTLFFTTKAFVIAEFVSSFYWQIAYFFGWVKENADAITYIRMITVFLIAFAVIEEVERRQLSKLQIKDVSHQEMISAIVVAVIAFLMGNISLLVEGAAFAKTTAKDLYSMRTLFDLLGMIIIYTFQSRIIEIEMKNDLIAMDHALKNQYDKYRNYQDHIELINMKYHDLKHLLEGVNQNREDAGNRLLLSHIGSELEEYSPMLETGNQVLNALLDSRRVVCKKENISMIIVADGKLLDFMHVADLCSVIGNALDNAIESVVLIDDPEQRIIRLEISRQKNFVKIVMENTYQHDIKLVDGLPVTTKSDVPNHGYGTRSILHVAEKYNGSAVFQTEDNWFRVQILIPCAQETE